MGNRVSARNICFFIVQLDSLAPIFVGQQSNNFHVFAEEEEGGREVKIIEIKIKHLKSFDNSNKNSPLNPVIGDRKQIEYSHYRKGIAANEFDYSSREKGIKLVFFIDNRDEKRCQGIEITGRAMGK